MVALTPPTDLARARPRPSSPTRRAGLAQLSLVEHALCPLDDQRSLARPLVFDTGYFRADAQRRAAFIPVRITAHEGLSANDELYLWGLLALAFSQPEPTLDFWATPHWCLRNLGFMESSKGGKNYANFRQVLRRLAGATYFCNRFYDPVKKCERDRAFGFLKYDLPTSDDSSRAWRIVFDPLLWEYCQALGGRLSFDWSTYRAFDPATRRLFLLLTKIFHRRTTSPRFDVWHLATHSLGFAPSLVMRDLKVKLLRCTLALLRAGVIVLPESASQPRDLFEKKGTGSYAITFHRGPYFDRSHDQGPGPTSLADSAIVDPLRTVGLDDRTIRWVLRTYRHGLIRTWTDITLAAMESKKPGFFHISPAAYLLDNLREAAAKRRTPPDWWHSLRTHRERARQQVETAALTESLEQNRDLWQEARRQAFQHYLDERVGREEYEQRVLAFRDIYAETLPAQQAIEEAIAEAERHFKAGFEFPTLEDWHAAQTRKPIDD